jgi:hypothetical protein
MTLAAQDGNGHSVQSTSVSRLRAIDNDAVPSKVLVTLQRQLPGRTHARAIIDSTLARRSLSVLEFVPRCGWRCPPTAVSYSNEVSAPRFRPRMTEDNREIGSQKGCQPRQAR